MYTKKHYEQILWCGCCACILKENQNGRVIKRFSDPSTSAARICVGGPEMSTLIQI